MSPWAKKALREAAHPKQPPTMIPYHRAISTMVLQPLGVGVFQQLGPGGEDYGKIWVRKQITDPKTGQKQDFLVVYTDDDREIIRQVTSSLEKESLLFVEKGQWVQNRETGEIGVVVNVDPTNERTTINTINGPRKRLQTEEQYAQWEKIDPPQFAQPGRSRGNMTRTAIDPIDQMKPMTWRNQESKKPKEEPDDQDQDQDQDQNGQDLQDQNVKPLNQSPQVLQNTDPNAGRGDYTIRVRPTDKAVEVKFEPQEPAVQDLEKELGLGGKEPLKPQQQNKQLEDLDIPVEY